MTAPDSRLYPVTSGPVAFINARLADLAEANALYGKDHRIGGSDKIARNDREISWLKDLRSIIATSAPAQGAPRCDRCGSSGDTYVLCSGCGSLSLSCPVSPADRGEFMKPKATDWRPIGSAPEHEMVLTKIHDERGSRNEAKLIRNGRLWFTKLGGNGMYVYYTPTHWRAIAVGEKS